MKDLLGVQVIGKEDTRNNKTKLVLEKTKRGEKPSENKMASAEEEDEVTTRIFVSSRSGQQIVRKSFGEGSKQLSFAFPADWTKQASIFCLDCGHGSELVGRTGNDCMMYCFNHSRSCHDFSESRTSYDVAVRFGLARTETTSNRAVPLIWGAEQVDALFSEEARANLQDVPGQICLG